MQKRNQITGLFFIHSKKCGIGGMETHQNAFIDYYITNRHQSMVRFNYIIENENNIFVVNKYLNGNLIKEKRYQCFSELLLFIQNIGEDIILLFLNDGWWIEYIPEFRKSIHKCFIFMRSGGNDAEIAPWNIGKHTYSERRKLWKKCINKLDYIIANSDFSVNRLLKLGVNPMIIKKIRGGVNEYVCTDVKNRKVELRKQLRRRLNIQQRLIFTFACRFVPFKGILQALNCIKQSSLQDSCHIILVGSGKLLPEIKRWCYLHLNDSQYSIMGELSNEETLYIIGSSDVLINASIECLTHSGDGIYIHTETMGRTMMEAISVNTKILATNVGGTEELFKENKGIGLLVPSNENSIICGLNTIESTLEETACQINNYSWNSVFANYNKLFMKLLEFEKLVDTNINR